MDPIPETDKESVKELSAKLKTVDPDKFGLLECHAAAIIEKHQEWCMVYRLPNGVSVNESEPETLRQKLLKCKTPSIADRIRLATQLARAVHSTHLLQLVHKSIRPENIITFKDKDSIIAQSFLFRFETSRDQPTILNGEGEWECNLYRHPQVQGPRIRERHFPKHDFYSLGVCLLEIALWESFVIWDIDNVISRPRTWTFSTTDPKNPVPPEEFVRNRLCKLSSAGMGEFYSDVVTWCITCLDPGKELDPPFVTFDFLVMVCC